MWALVSVASTSSLASLAVTRKIAGCFAWWARLAFETRSRTDVYSLNVNFTCGVVIIGSLKIGPRRPPPALPILVNDTCITRRYGFRTSSLSSLRAYACTLVRVYRFRPARCARAFVLHGVFWARPGETNAHPLRYLGLQDEGERACTHNLGVQVNSHFTIARRRTVVHVG